MDSVMKGLMGQCPLPQNFWARTAPGQQHSEKAKNKYIEQKYLLVIVSADLDGWVERIDDAGDEEST